MDNKDAMSYWLEELDQRSDGTKRNYLSQFNTFVERCGLTAQELYERQKTALASGDPRDRKEVVNTVRQYMKKREEEGKAPGTVRGVVKAVKSFFEANELEFTIKSKDLPPNAYDGQNIIQREQIATLLGLVGAEFRERNRAIIMLLKDSGLRVSDVSPLNVGDYRNAREERNEAGEPFKVFAAQLTKKKKIYAYVHVGPETVKAMNAYLKVRESEEGPLSDDAPLFTQRLKERATAHALSAQLKRLCELLGKDGRKVSAHSLRKYHTTMLQIARVHDAEINKLQGKATSVYSQTEKTGDLTKSYISAYDSIRINTSEAIKERETEKRIARDAEEIKKLKVQVESERARGQSEIEKLRAEMFRRFEKLEQEPFRVVTTPEERKSIMRSEWTRERELPVSDLYEGDGLKPSAGPVSNEELLERLKRLEEKS